MKLTYETGTATLIQFIVLGLLNIATGLQSIISTCAHDRSSCVSNLITSMIFYILIVGWFGVICVLGFGAQEKRSKRIAQLLICAEVAVAFIAFFNIKLNLKYHNGFLSLFTSVADLVLAIWIISLAYRLIKAGGGRVVAKQRARKRPTSGTHS